MTDSEFKTVRKVLLAPFSGNTAFKDDTMEKRWKEKQAAKRDVPKAAKAEKQNTEDLEVDADEISE